MITKSLPVPWYFEKLIFILKSVIEIYFKFFR